MALDDAPRASLHDDEDGTAAVEFVVLLPVYLLMVSGLFAITFMVTARQALPIVARYEVWAGSLDAAEREEILGSSGSYEVIDSQSTDTPLSLEKTLEVLQGNESSVVGVKQKRHEPMAKAYLLNDIGGTFEAPFERRTLTARFNYTGLLIFGAAMDGFQIQASTYVALPHTRKVHERGQQAHYGEEDGARPNTVTASEVPSQNEYLPAKFGSFQQDGPSRGRDPGIWDIHARIGGAERAERDRTRGWKSNR